MTKPIIEFLYKLSINTPAKHIICIEE